MKPIKKAHAKFSPSAAHRWMACPGSIVLSNQCPPPKESPAAIEGTNAHTCLEYFLKAGIKKANRAETFLSKKFPIEMVKHAFASALLIWKAAPKGAEILAETKALMPHISDHFYGTTDASIVSHFGVLEIIDFKYGRMPVEAENNPQLIAYAIGIAHKYDYNFSSVVCTIIQPRAVHEDGPVRSWAAPIETLFEWTEKFKAAIKKTRAFMPELSPGEHCYFCPAKTICPEYSKDDMKSIKSKFIRPLTGEARLEKILLDYGD